MQQNTLDRKRQGPPLDNIPEAKRPSARAATTAQSDAVAAASEEAKKPAGEETYEEIHERTGMTVTDILGRKLTFKKGTMPAKKLEEMGPVIKELK